MRVLFLSCVLVAAAPARFLAQTPALSPVLPEERMARVAPDTLEPGQQPRQPSPVAPREPAPTRQPEPVQPTRAQEPGAPRQPAPVGQPVNIRLQIAIADEGNGGEASQKIVTMILADRAAGSIRSAGSQNAPVSGPAVTVNREIPVNINVDAMPELLRDGLIRLNLGLEYAPVRTTAPDGTPSQPNRGQLTQRLTVVLADGKPLVISEAADAATSRRVKVTLTATVLK